MLLEFCEFFKAYLLILGDDVTPEFDYIYSYTILHVNDGNIQTSPHFLRGWYTDV